jgi:hypothetical protein
MNAVASVQPGNPSSRERLSTVDLLFVKEVKKIPSF